MAWRVLVALPMAKLTFVAAAALAALSACKKSSSNSPQVLAVTVGQSGFSPATLSVAEGRKAVVRFTRTTDNTCAKKIVFPTLHIEKSLPLNTAVDVAIPSNAPRTVAFQCGMGMLKGAVVVR